MSAGCDVHVYERSSGVLRDRGSGIAIPLELRRSLVEEGYLAADTPHCTGSGRLWVIADGSASGRVLWTQPGPGSTNNWGLLWRAVRASVPVGRYHDGTVVAGFTVDHDGVDVRFGDGRTERFDVLVGADGYRSAIRRHVAPDSAPRYAGYVLWRGNYPESRLTHRAAIDLADQRDAGYAVCLDGAQGVYYPIPDFDGRTDVGHRRINWAVYTAAPPGLTFDEPTSIPPGAVTPAQYATLADRLRADFPSDLRAVITESRIEEVSIQPIYDEVIETYVRGRVVVVGDASTITRPHTGSGATKALQDALALQRLALGATDWSELLAAFDAERAPAGAALVELGRRIGRDQVEHTPDWTSMGPDDFDAWTKATLAGTPLYFYGDGPEPTPNG